MSNEPQRTAWVSGRANYVYDLKLLERLKLIEIGVIFLFRYSEQIGPMSRYPSFNSGRSKCSTKSSPAASTSGKLEGPLGCNCIAKGEGVHYLGITGLVSAGVLSGVFFKPMYTNVKQLLPNVENDAETDAEDLVIQSDKNYH
ncbi:hypothetical protein B0H13DRAFT_1898086 [Mycena leptocephala]|nr:hypothetical protein B0H13DRAFT_1898086 [Mycena leptocephala]